MPGYIDRYCAFVDILGFGDLIKKLGTGEIEEGSIHMLLSEIEQPVYGDPAVYKDADIQVSLISDAVAISAAVTHAGLAQLVYSLEQLSISFLELGYLLRGAIVKGKLFHNGDIVFGEALIDAHRLEREVARYPRIMITRQVALDAKGIVQWGLKSRIRQAEDGPFFVHVLNDFEHRWMEKLKQNSLTSFDECDDLLFYSHIRRYLQQRYEESVDNPRHFEKVQWFVRYWNDVMEPKGILNLVIKGPGLDHRPAYWG